MPRRMPLAGLALTALLAGLLAGWLVWKQRIEDQNLTRSHAYVRAFAEATARAAGPDTQALFVAFAPPPPGSTGSREIPCPRDQALLRGAGVGQCWIGNFPVKPRPLPMVCRFMPCVFIGISEPQWRDPAVQTAAVTLRRDPTAPCRAQQRETDKGWRQSDDDLKGDCTAWRWLKGPVFVAIERDDPHPDGTPHAMRQLTSRYVRVF